MNGLSISRYGMWFRIAGYGLSVKFTPALFSERYGHRKVLRVCGVGFEILKPEVPRG